MRTFLMLLDEYQQIFRRVERRLRDPRVVEIASDPGLKIDTKADFSERGNVEKLVDKLKPLKIQPDVRADEEHSAWMAVYHDSTNAERFIGIELSTLPEYRRRGLATQLMRRAMDELASAGLVPVLDATPDVRAVYRLLFFEYSFVFHRLIRR